MPVKTRAPKAHDSPGYGNGVRRFEFALHPPALAHDTVMLTEDSQTKRQSAAEESLRIAVKSWVPAC